MIYSLPGEEETSSTASATAAASSTSSSSSSSSATALTAKPTATVSWADKLRAAKSQEQQQQQQDPNASSSSSSSAPAAVIVGPLIATSLQGSAAAAATASSLSSIEQQQGTAELADLPKSEKGTVVLDANAFIKGFDNFLATADVFITTSQVIQECRDRRTRDFLERLPMRIEILEPTAESIRAVVSMAEKTGDVGMLSRTDLRVCALGLDVAKHLQVVGKVVDPRAPTVNSEQIENDNDNSSDGYDDDEEEEEDSDDYEDYDSDEEEEEGENQKKTTKKKKKKTNNKEEDRNWLDVSDSDEEGDKKEENNKEKKKKQKNDSKKEKKEEKVQFKETLPGWGTFEDDWGVPANEQKSKNQLKRERKAEKKSSAATSGGAKESVTAAAAASSSETQKPEQVEQPKISSSSSPTPAASTSSVPPAVASLAAPDSYKGGYACVTSDFPMQNVLLHLGVPVVGSSGQCIKELRVWVLRCHACTCIVHDTTRQFCPDCGSGDTLRRVHYVLDEKGEKHLFINFKHRISTRGTIFNLSRPRGGRKGTNKTLVLREDQLRNCGKAGMAARKKKESAQLQSALMDEYEEGLRGFGDRDEKAGRRDGNFLLDKSSYTRKNVTEMRKARASRRK